MIPAIKAAWLGHARPGDWAQPDPQVGSARGTQSEPSERAVPLAPRSPWPLGKGRRFGDPAWALAAVGRAWILGGSERRWPRCAWIGSPLGPVPETLAKTWDPRPDPAWISLLRHGTPGLPAERPRPKEEPLESMAWAALLEGEARPFLHLGLLWLDLDTRLRWIPPMAAVDEEGTLHLPPFLAPLIPEEIRTLPAGWWETLLWSMDGEGRLLPSGVPPKELEGLDPEALRPLTLPIIDPRLRAWFRGEGASPAALRTLLPDSLGLGGAPDDALRSFLAGNLPETFEGPWRESLAADLAEGPRPAPPAPSGQAPWDWIRVRWGAEAPAPSAGYPGPDQFPGASCDPFHAVALSRLAFRQGDAERALWSSAFAEAHFRRLKAPFWAKRAAYNAAGEAFFWGDLGRAKAYRARMGALPFPFDVLTDLQDLLLLGEFTEVLRRLPDVESHPVGAAAAQVFRAHALLDLGHWEAAATLPQEGLPSDLSRVVTALAREDFGPMEDLDAEHRLLWESVRTRKGHHDPAAFWSAWEGCPNALLRLGEGLLALEACPEARLPARLLQLQELARRCGSETLKARLAALWPAPPAVETVEPRQALTRLLAQHSGPAWVLGPQPPLGQGEPPPPALMDLLREQDACGPVPHGDWLWWGRSLPWNGGRAGWLLLGFPPNRPLAPPAWADLLGPWVASLQCAPAAPSPTDPGGLLTDGSEPMASFLRDLDRMAPARLSILLTGPSGSGKELAARELHRRSGRKGAIISVNCSEFGPAVVESDLFGHVKGAYTGATKDRVGAIEQARGGTLFLDEVADLEPRLQSMLLRVIEEKEIRRMGSERPIPVDVRVVSATHRDLESLVRQGHFREDLRFRLQGAALEVPALDARRHEFAFLVPRLVARLGREEGLAEPPLAPGLAEALARRNWPGNVRELRNHLHRALLRRTEGPLTLTHFPELAEEGAAADPWDEATRAFQRTHLLAALRRHGFHITRTAQALGLARPALYATAKRLGVDLAAERGEE